MRRGPPLKKIADKVHERTVPIGDLSRAILDGSYEMAKSLRPSMSFKTQKENEEKWVYVLFEFQYLLLHLVSSLAVLQVGPEKRSVLLEDLGPLVIQPTINTIFSHWPDDLKDRIKSEYYENLAKSEYEYGTCKQIWNDKGVDNMNDIVLHCFSKNVARMMGNENNLGLFLEIQQTLVQGLENIQFIKLLKKACDVL